MQLFSDLSNSLNLVSSNSSASHKEILIFLANNYALLSFTEKIIQQKRETTDPE
jgi:hypothetical protein